MNEEIRERSAVDNPFVFKHISNLKGMDHFDDVGPCVVLASPGMMQVWPLTQFFSVSFFVRGNTILLRSSQQLPRLRLGPSKGFLS